MTREILYIVPFGLEKVSNSQINGSIATKSIIIKKYDNLEKVIIDTYFLRVHYRSLLFISRFKADTLEEIEYYLNSLNWKEWIPYGTFACRCSRRGTHTFKSIDIEKLCGSIILEKTTNLSVNLTKPDTIVRIIIDNSDVFVGLDLVGYESMHKRGYRIFQHPSALNPVLAYHLVLLAGSFNSLLDPTCGGGTTLIEACHHKLNIPAGLFRNDNLAMVCLPYLKERIDVENVLKDVPVNFQNCNDISIVGIDNSPKILEGCRKNIINAKCSQCIRLINSDIVIQTVKFGKKFNAIVSNPPYGIRLGNPQKALRVHRAIAELALQWLGPGGRIVVITPHLQFFSECLNAQPIEQFKTFSGDLPVDIGVFELK